MAFWAVLALMAVAAMLFAVLPLVRHRRAAAGPGDVEVYRDQLAEIDRDLKRGLVAAGEAEAARAEIGRRLIAAADRAERAGPEPERGRRAAWALTALLVPALGFGLYLALGAPGRPDKPLAARYAAPLESLPPLEQLMRIEAEVRKDPKDPRAERLADFYMQNGGYANAAELYGLIIAAAGETADRLARRGEALVMAAQGQVDAEARRLFERTLALDPKSPRGRFYLAIATEQAGDKAGAIERLKALVADAEPGADWLATVQGELARLEGRPADARPGPSAADVEAASKMTADEQKAMIRTMVEGLAARLKTEPGDVQGWLRLVRSYAVLGEAEKAKAAVAEAKAALSADVQAVGRIDALAAELKL